VLLPAHRVAAPAHAQVNPFKGQPSANRLTQEDRDAMTEAAGHLYSNDAASIGSSESWQNDKSGASGSVTLGAMFNRKAQNVSYACRRIDYAVLRKGQASPVHYHANWRKCTTTPTGAKRRTAPGKCSRPWRASPNSPDRVRNALRCAGTQRRLIPNPASAAPAANATSVQRMPGGA